MTSGKKHLCAITIHVTFAANGSFIQTSAFLSVERNGRALLVPVTVTLTLNFSFFLLLQGGPFQMHI